MIAHLCVKSVIFLLNSSLSIHSLLSIPFPLIPVITSCIHEFRSPLLFLPGGHHSKICRDSLSFYSVRYNHLLFVPKFRIDKSKNSFDFVAIQSTHCCQFPSLSFLLLLLASTNFEVLYFFFQVDTIPKFVEIAFHFTLPDTMIYYFYPSLGLIKVKTASTS
jgi:hypothetical protein